MKNIFFVTILSVSLLCSGVVRANKNEEVAAPKRKSNTPCCSIMNDDAQKHYDELCKLTQKMLDGINEVSEDGEKVDFDDLSNAMRESCDRLKDELNKKDVLVALHKKDLTRLVEVDGLMVAIDNAALGCAETNKIALKKHVTELQVVLTELKDEPVCDSNVHVTCQPIAWLGKQMYKHPVAFSVMTYTGVGFSAFKWYTNYTAAQQVEQDAYDYQ